MIATPHQQPTKTQVASKLLHVFLQHKDRTLKALQYVSLFVSWYFQSRGHKQSEEKYFLLYKAIFYARRMYRVGSSIIFIRPIIDQIKEVRRGPTVQRISALLMNIFKFVFYTLDTIAIGMKFTGHPAYLKARRISFAMFLLSLVFSLILHTKKLRASFTKQKETKLVGIDSRSFMSRMREIDHERTFLSLTIFSNLGDLFPTMQRISVTEELLYTRMNRGTVAFFGGVSASVDLAKAYLYD